MTYPTDTANAAYSPVYLDAAEFVERFAKFSRDVLAGPNDYGYDLDDHDELASVRKSLIDFAIEVHRIEVRRA